MTIIVTENLEKGIVELFIPFCRLCRSYMQPETGLAVTPKPNEMLPVNNVKFRIKSKDNNILPRKILDNTAPGTEGTEVGYGTIATFIMNCPIHNSERESLTQEQLDLINKYPIQRQLYRKVPLTKRK